MNSTTSADCVVTINEVMYHPSHEDTALEWIELHNHMSIDEDLSDWFFEGGIQYRFPKRTVIQAGGYLVVAENPTALQATGYSGALGPFAGRLANGGEKLVLRNLNGRLMDELAYSDEAPWPVAADGSGASLAKRWPGTPSSSAENWRASREAGGTPGRVNFPETAPSQPPITDTLLALGASGRWWVPSEQEAGLAWRQVGFDDTGWRQGSNGFGFDHSVLSSLTPPAHYYRFERTAADTSGSSVQALIQNSAHYVADPAPAVDSHSSLLLDGSTDQVSVDDSIVPTSYTLTVWVKLKELRECSLGLLTDTNGPLSVWSHQLRVNAKGQFEHSTYDGSHHVVTGTTVASPGRWYHVAGTAEKDGLMRLFVNGVEEGTSLRIGTPASSGSRWVFGSNSAESLNFFKGWLDEIGIWRQALPPDQIAAFAAGASPDKPGGLIGLFATDTGSAMHGVNSTLWARLPFVIPNGVFFDQLTLRLRYDAGFVAWLNGIEIARRNAPATPSWNASATDERPIDEAAQFESIDVTSSVATLQSGVNVLALQGLNLKADDPDFLLQAELLARQGARPTSDVSLSFSELSAASAIPFWCELLNHGASPLQLQDFSIRSSSGAAFQFSPKTLEPGQFVVVDATELGFTVELGARLFLQSADGAWVHDAVAVKARSQARRAEEPAGAFLLPAVLTPGASNEFALHREVVINEIFYHAPPTYADPGTATPFAVNEEQWIELYNRSSRAVDLTGWQLTDAIEFLFPAQTVLQPDQYLVIARDAVSLRSRFPAIAVLGDFQGKLSQGSQRIVLLDANGNPADEVRYFRDKPWPHAADGGGSSLELRNPFADKSAPQAWAASDETMRSDWRHYSYTMRAAAPVFGPPLHGFQELRLGLLDDGELLLDNVSVIEDPSGVPRELVQNGQFDDGSAKWRLLGNHSHSRVDDDPNLPGNKVLRVIATDARGYLDNQIETTLKNNGVIVPVQAGKEYQVSFDAKWLAGSPQFNTELYYNRVARKTVLEQPALHGTPGRRNSTYAANLGPTFTDLRHSPPVPKPGEPIGVSVRATDPDGVDVLALRYRVNDGAWLSIAMPLQTDGSFAAVIPPQAIDRAVIQFYVEGRDVLGATSQAPAAGPDSRALIRVDSRVANVKRPSFYLILTSHDSSLLHEFKNMMSDDRLGATVVWDDREVFYDCGVHLHGSMFSRADPNSAAFNIKFPADHFFRGVHGSVQIKRRVMVEIVAKHVQNQSGLPGMYEDIVELFSHVPGNAGPARMSMAQYNDIFLSSQFEHGGNGSLFNMEGIRVAMATDNNTPEGIKLPFPIDWVGNYDIADLGNDPEQYRWTTTLRSNRPQDDYAPYIAMAKAFSLNGAALQRAAPSVMDVDEWMRLFALVSLFGIGDTYTQGNPHNVNFYVRPTDGRVLAFPYDWDFFFSLSANAPLWGDQNLSKIIALPIYTRLFHGHLLDLMETSFNADYLLPWVTKFGSAAGEDYRYVLDRVRARSQYVRGRLPVKIAFEITTNDGADFSVITPAAALEGRAWIDVREIRLADLNRVLPLTWLDANRWRTTIPLLSGNNPITLQAYNRRGELVGQDTVNITTTTPDDSQRSSLRVSEVMYHPGEPSAAELAAGFSDPDDFEFIEIGNFGAQDISLSGVRFTLGIQFDFTGSAVTNLPPGARVVIVRSSSAFLQRYGSTLPVAGQYTGSLDNGGELIRLVDRNDLVIQEFTYQDTDSWPRSADGGGDSLVPLDVNSDYNAPSNWRASSVPGGSPGWVERRQPAIRQITFDKGTIAFGFEAQAGQSYRLLFNDQLSSEGWRVLQVFPPAAATSIIEVTEPFTGGIRQRFYQLVSP